MNPLPRLAALSASDRAFGVAADVPGFAAAGMALRERSDIGCLLINCACDANAVAESLAIAVGFDLPRECGRVSQSSPCTAIWLTPRSWLLQCDPAAELQLAERIDAAFGDQRVHVSLFTDAIAWMELSGPRAPALLSAGGFVSLEREGLAVGHAKRTTLAGIAVVVMRSRPNTWLLAVERSRYRYFIEWLKSAVPA